MSIGYHPDFGTSVPYRFVSLPASADGQVRATIKEVLNGVRSDARHPFMIEHARQLGLRGADARKDIFHTWQHVRGSMRFQQDEDSARRFQVPKNEAKSWGFPDDTIEVVVRPIDQALLIRLRGVGFEDCDGFEGYAACLLTIAEIPTSLVTISADEEQPARFSHVYLAAYPNGYGTFPRIPLDFSHGDFPGWEARNLGRLKEWPIKITAGEVLSDAILPVGLLFGAWWFLRRAA